LISLVKIPALAEDLTHEVFLKVWEVREKLKINENVAGYLFRMAHNKAVDGLQRIVGERTFKDELLKVYQISYGNVHHSQKQWEQLDKLIDQALDSLPPQRRMNWELRPIPFSPSEYQKIESYIEQGGNLMMLSVPGKQTIMNPLLKLVGLEFMEGQLASNTTHFASDHIFTTFDTSTIVLAPNSPMFADMKRDKEENRHLHVEDGIPIDGAVAIKIIDSSKFKMQPIFQSVKNYAWLQRRPLVLDSAKSIYTPSAGDSAGIFSMGMMLTRMVGDKEQRIVVMNGIINENSTKHSFLEPYSWLNYNEFPLYMPKKYQQDQLRIDNKTALRWRFVFLYILPSLIFISATVLLIRRKRR
jgi:RNA polymerase sigma factor (sigma-70 family)